MGISIIKSSKEKGLLLSKTQATLIWGRENIKIHRYTNSFILFNFQAYLYAV